MIIKSKAPTRIDLAGGTIDIWPLYLFHDRAVTVNAAINVYARAAIIPGNDKTIIIESRDTHTTVTARSLSRLKDTELALISRLIKFYSPERGFHIITSSDAPTGSGLGGSSALAIAVSGALNRFTGGRYKKKDLISITKDIEAQVIKVPPGEQDYYPAIYGGLNALWLNVGGVKREPLNKDLQKISERLILCYTGGSRFSGTNNWAIMKRHIDGDREIYALLERIKDIAGGIREAIVSGDMEMIGKMIKSEWNNRKKLFKGVTNKRIDNLISFVMRKGAISAKVCGAGGGGCIVFFVKDGCRNMVADELIKRGGKVIDFTIVKKGLEVKQLR